MSPTYDFDSAPDRSTIPGEKWGRYAGRDVIPMWVADMDFAVAPEIREALARRLAHPVYGYTDPWPSLVEAVCAGIERDHGWTVAPEWLVWLPGVIPGFHFGCAIAPGEVIVTHTPVYPPFLAAPANVGKRLRAVDLVCAKGRWVHDEAAMVAAFAPGDVGALLLCHPHNPTGRLWDEKELAWLAELALAHGAILVSDDIHAGLVLTRKRRHRPIATLAPEVAARTITLFAPSKTWNVPALQCAFAVIPDEALRARYRRALRGRIPSSPNLFGLVATEAAYRDGWAWREALLEYLRGNVAFALESIRALDLPVAEPEATYLLWIDVRRLGLEDAAAHFEAHGLGLSDGAAFGAPGFVRLNLGCPRSRLAEGLRRFARAVEAARQRP